MKLEFKDKPQDSDKILRITSTDQDEKIFLMGYYDKRLPPYAMEINEDDSVTVILKH